MGAKGAAGGRRFLQCTPLELTMEVQAVQLPSLSHSDGNGSSGGRARRSGGELRRKSSSELGRKGLPPELASFLSHGGGGRSPRSPSA